MNFIKKIPNWAKALIIGGGLGFFVLICLGGAYVLFFLRPFQAMESPTPTRVILPTAETIPMPVATLALPTQPPTATLTATATKPPTATPVPQYCHTFARIPMSVVYMDWVRGDPLEFYIKMPGGVPGLEKKIPKADDDWVYTAKIGNYTSGKCEFIPGYPERLYCEIILPQSYAESVQPMSLFVNKCEGDIYPKDSAFLPPMKR